MPTSSCSVSIPVAWSISARCSARYGGCPPGPVSSPAAPAARSLLSSSSTAAVSANTSASPSWSALSGPGWLRYSSSTPTRIAPICSGNTKTAAAPAWRAAPTAARPGRYDFGIKVKGGAGAGDGQHLRQRVRAALRHGEGDRIHLPEHIGPHDDAHGNSARVTGGLKFHLAAVSTRNQSRAGQLLSRDSHGYYRRRRTTGGGQDQPLPAVRGALRSGPIECRGAAIADLNGLSRQAAARGHEETQPGVISV